MNIKKFIENEFNRKNLDKITKYINSFKRLNITYEQHNEKFFILYFLGFGEQIRTTFKTIGI